MWAWCLDDSRQLYIRNVTEIVFEQDVHSLCGFLFRNFAWALGFSFQADMS